MMSNEDLALMMSDAYSPSMMSEEDLALIESAEIMLMYDNDDPERYELVDYELERDDPEETTRFCNVLTVQEMEAPIDKYLDEFFPCTRTQEGEGNKGGGKNGKEGEGNTGEASGDESHQHHEEAIGSSSQRKASSATVGDADTEPGATDTVAYAEPSREKPKLDVFGPIS